jgi:ACS family glucarate transporter-like MFS transporter
MSNLPTKKSSAFPIRYLLVFWLFVFSAVAYLDRTNISVAGIQIGKEFSIDHVHLGWVFSAFLIGYAVFQVPAGLLAHRYGSRLVLTFAAIWWAVFTVLTAVVSPKVGGALMILVLVRFALGAGEATMYPATSQFVERWFPVEERGKANGIIFGGVGVGSGIAPPLVAAIIAHYGWRASFWFSALIGIVVGIVWYLAARDSPEQHPFVQESELSLIRQGTTSQTEIPATDISAPKSKRIVPWARILRSKEIFALTVSYFSFGYVAWIFFGWFYIYLAEVRGLDLKASALYSMLPFISMTVGCLLGGVLSDWIARRFDLRLGRCMVPAFCMVITAILLVLGSRAREAVTASLILAAGAGILYISQSCFWAVTADFAGEYTGLASGIMNMGAQIGGACTASVTPIIAAHFGWQMSFAVAASLALLGAVAWLFVDPRRSLTVPLSHDAVRSAS